jgi:hypothetical protein
MLIVLWDVNPPQRFYDLRNRTLLLQFFETFRQAWEDRLHQVSHDLLGVLGVEYGFAIEHEPADRGWQKNEGDNIWMADHVEDKLEDATPW